MVSIALEKSKCQFKQTIGVQKPTGTSQKWYFVTKIVLTYCEKKNVLNSDQENFLQNFLDDYNNLYEQ